MAPRVSWLAASATPRLSARHALKIDLQCLLPDLALQLSQPVLLVLPLPAQARKRCLHSFAELAPPSVQHVRVDLAGAGPPQPPTPHLQPPHRGQFELLRELSSPLRTIRAGSSRRA